MRIAGYKIIEAQEWIDKKRLSSKIQAYLQCYLNQNTPSEMLRIMSERSPINSIRMGSYIEPDGFYTETDGSINANCTVPSSDQIVSFDQIINTINQQFVEWDMPSLKIFNHFNQPLIGNGLLDTLVSSCETLPSNVGGYNNINSVPNKFVVGTNANQLTPFDKHIFIHELMHFFGMHPQDVSGCNLKKIPKELLDYMCQANQEGNHGSTLIYPDSCYDLGSSRNYSATPTGLGGIDLALIRSFYAKTKKQKRLDLKDSTERILAEISKMPPHVQIQSKSASHLASAICGNVFESLSNYAIAKSDLSPTAKNILFKAINTLGLLVRMGMVLGSVQDKKILAMIGTHYASHVSQTLKAVMGLLHAVGLGATLYSLIAGHNVESGRIALQSFLGTLIGKAIGELLISATGVGRSRPQEYINKRAENLANQPDFFAQQVDWAVNAMPTRMQQVLVAIDHLDQQMASLINKTLGMGFMTTTGTVAANSTQVFDIELQAQHNSEDSTGETESLQALQIMDVVLHDTHDHEVTSAILDAQVATTTLRGNQPNGD